MTPVVDESLLSLTNQRSLTSCAADQPSEHEIMALHLFWSLTLQNHLHPIKQRPRHYRFVATGKELPGRTHLYQSNVEGIMKHMGDAVLRDLLPSSCTQPARVHFFNQLIDTEPF